jgi:electron transport complex protein RnfG
MYGHGVAVPSYRKRVGYQAMLLGGMATLASALLVLGDMETREDIALRQAEDLKASLRQVLPDALHDNDLLSDVLVLPAADGEEPLKVYRAHRERRISAVAFEVSAIGYAGPVTSIMGIDAEGKVLGVRVIAHAETPGLGDKIEIARNDWILSFNGRSLENTPVSHWQVKKDGGQFDQFTGATITPRAVVKSVYQGLQLFNQYRSRLLTLNEGTEETQGPLTTKGDSHE